MGIINSMKKIFLMSFAVCLTFFCMSGCIPYLTYDNGADQKERKGTEYTVEELMAKALVNNSNLENIDDDDCTEEAMYAYNQMLGYVENDIGMEYKIYDFYHVNFKTEKSYVIKIVLIDNVPEMEEKGTNINISDPRIIMLSCDEDGRNVKSGVVPHLMASKWSEDIVAAIGEKFPEYHTNIFYVYLNNIYPYVSSFDYTDFYDYTYYYKEKERKYCDNVINVIVPVGTPESDASEIYKELLPILEKYFVTEVRIAAPADDEAYDRIIEEEKPEGNLYQFDSENVAWEKGFSVERTQ